MPQGMHNLEDLLEHMRQAHAEQGDVTLDAVVDAVGRRSFGPLLLMSGVVIASPLSGIPGLPTALSILVLLIAGQLIAGRKHFWLPQWLLKRSVSQEKLHKAIKWLKKPARFIDRLIKPRLTYLVQRTGTFAIAAICVLIGIGMPMMEFVPFSASAAGTALAAFGLALVAHDGLVAILAFVFTALTAGLVFYALVLT